MDSIRHWRLIVSNITSHFSQKALLHFSFSNSNRFDCICFNILGFFRLPINKRQIIFWCKKSLKIVLSCQKLWKTNPNPTFPSLTISMSCFFERIRTSNSFVDTTMWQMVCLWPNCLLPQVISVWWIVWVTKNCRSLSDMSTYKLNLYVCVCGIRKL
jgi:hypothetical protein